MNFYRLFGEVREVGTLVVVMLLTVFTAASLPRLAEAQDNMPLGRKAVAIEPQAFGKVMSQIKPRLAVGYHSVQSPENNAAIMDGVRKTYDGPLALARDLMVINVTKEDIKVRMAVVDEYVLPPNVTKAYKEAPRTDKKEPSDWTLAGKWKGYTPPPMPKK